MMKKNDNDNSSNRRNSLSSFAEAVMPLVRKILGRKGMMMADIIAMWEQIVGSEIAGYTMPQKIDFPRSQKNGGTLTLAVPSGAFAIEVRYREKYLLEKINVFFGYNAISAIKIVQGGKVKIGTAKQSNQPMMQKTLVSDEEQNYIIELTDGVANTDLQEKLISLGKHVFSRNHSE